MRGFVQNYLMTIWSNFQDFICLIYLFIFRFQNGQSQEEFALFEGNVFTQKLVDFRSPKQSQLLINAYHEALSDPLEQAE